MLNINSVIWDRVTAEDIKKQIEKTDVNENQFFEFKSAKESPPKMMKEISAFSNTFGGYIFIGVENNKTITGRGDWTEERIHTTIHDSISPTPLFDVKEFMVDNKPVLVVRIEEGPMPPYIVKAGIIYERVSSGSYPIHDINKLNQLMIKTREFNSYVARAIEIEPIDQHSTWYPQNICAYIDMGFFVINRDEKSLLDKIRYDGTLDKVAALISNFTDEFNISVVGNRIVVTLLRATVHDGNGKEVMLDSGIQHFMEVLNNGSIRLRILLTIDINTQRASLTIVDWALNILQSVYSTIVGSDFDKSFLYALKYEKLTVLRQFEPYYYLDDSNPQEIVNKYMEYQNNEYKRYGKRLIVIGNRFPVNDYYCIDQQYFDEVNLEWKTRNIINELFSSRYINIGFVGSLLPNEC